MPASLLCSSHGNLEETRESSGASGSMVCVRWNGARWEWGKLMLCRYSPGCKGVRSGGQGGRDLLLSFPFSSLSLSAVTVETIRALPQVLNAF